MRLLAVGALLVSIVWATPCLAQPSGGSVLDRFMDKMLKRAGLDPKAPEAAVAKRTGMHWLDPRTSASTIDKDLRDTRKLINVGGAPPKVASSGDGPSPAPAPSSPGGVEVRNTSAGRHSLLG